MKIIKKIREESGLTLHQVADATGLSPSLVNGFEHGTMDNPKFKTVELLANFFHADKDEIYKAGKRIPRDIFFQIVDSEKTFDEIRVILNQAGV